MDRVVVAVDTSRRNTDRYLKKASGRMRHKQKPVVTKCVFEGCHLEIAILRAKRWIRRGSKAPQHPPRHILLMLAAFAKADPSGFKAARQEAVDNVA